MPARSVIAIALLSAPAVFAAALSTPVSKGFPSPVRRAAGCTATVTGSNSEGGGGPGQEPIDNNAYGVTIVSPNGMANGDCSETGSTAVPCDTVPSASFGGTIDAACSGSWDGGSNSWFNCQCNGVDGAVQDATIDSGTVSVTTDNCIVLFDC